MRSPSRTGSGILLLARPSLIAIVALVVATPDRTRSAEVVLHVRAGNLDPVERSPTGAATPNLRSLLQRSAVLPRVDFAAALRAAAESGERATATAVADALVPETVLAHLREQGVSRLVIEGGPEEERPEAPAPTEEEQESEGDEALARLHELFGEPPPISEAERGAVKTFREILGLAPRDDLGEAESAAQEPPAPRLSPAERVTEALRKGAGLIVVVEQVDTPSGSIDNEPSSGEQPRGAPDRRDLFLGTLLSAVAKREGSVFVLVSLVDRTGEDGYVLASGPGVRAGWIVPRRVSMKELTATLLRLLDSKPLASDERTEAVDEILGD